MFGEIAGEEEVADDGHNWGFWRQKSLNSINKNLIPSIS